MRKIQPVSAIEELRSVLAKTSQVALGEKAGVPQPNISQMLNGRRSVSRKLLKHLGLKRITVVVRDRAARGRRRAKA